MAYESKKPPRALKVSDDHIQQIQTAAPHFPADILNTLWISVYRNVETEEEFVSLILAAIGAGFKINHLWQKPFHSVGFGNKKEIIAGIFAHRITAHQTGERGEFEFTEYGDRKDFNFKGKEPIWKNREIIGYKDFDVNINSHEYMVARISRIVKGQERWTTTSRVYFKEAVSLTKYGAPVGMWNTKPTFMLAKVAEARALCIAFPDSSPSNVTFEEVAGVDLDDTGGGDIPAADAATTPIGGKIEAKPEPSPVNTNPKPVTAKETKKARTNIRFNDHKAAIEKATEMPALLVVGQSISDDGILSEHERDRLRKFYLGRKEIIEKQESMKPKPRPVTVKADTPEPPSSPEHNPPPATQSLAETLDDDIPF